MFHGLLCHLSQNDHYDMYATMSLPKFPVSSSVIVFKESCSTCSKVT